MSSVDVRSRDDLARDRNDKARNRDDAARIRDDFARESEMSFAKTIKKWSTLAVLSLCFTLTALWVAIVWRQNRIINRLDNLDAILQQRTGRFERIEKIEAEQSEILRRLDSGKEGK